MKRSILVLLSLAGLALYGCKPTAEPARKPSVTPAGKGTAVPGISLPSLTSGQPDIRLADFKGKVVLLDFWATWCPPCRHELPYLQKIHSHLSPRGFSIVGMTVDNGSVESVSPLVARFQLNYPLGLAGPDIQSSFGGIRAVPTKFLLDRTGSIRKHYEGVVPEAQLRADIVALLDEPSS